MDLAVHMLLKEIGMSWAIIGVFTCFRWHEVTLCIMCHPSNLVNECDFGAKELLTICDLLASTMQVTEGTLQMVLKTALRFVILTYVHVSWFWRR
jgi:hypothetical protein